MNPVIEAIIDAGNWAPSGANRQPWRFVVVEDKEFIRKLIDAALPTYKSIFSGFTNSKDEGLRDTVVGMGSRCLGWPSLTYEETVTRLAEMENGIYWSAPVIIFVIGTSGRESALASGNMTLAAQSLGLGSCIVGFGTLVADDEGIAEAFQLKENEKIHDCVVVGYPEIVPEPPKKMDPEVIWI